MILAPFALGYQPYGVDWVNQTTADFATGIPVAVVALVAFAFFFAALLGALRAAGVLAARKRPIGVILTKRSVVPYTHETWPKKILPTGALQRVSTF